MGVSWNGPGTCHAHLLTHLKITQEGQQTAETSVSSEILQVLRSHFVISIKIIFLYRVKVVYRYHENFK